MNPQKVQLPQVGIVVPVKGSQATIRACVDSLLTQDYAGEIKIVLVGDMDDSTWLPILDLLDSRHVSHIEARITSARRDANAKRNLGLDHLQTPIMALTDSDMILPPDWVSTAVELIRRDGWQCVAGSMRSVYEGFWATYIDQNPIYSKTPRMKTDYVVDTKNFGVSARPPITAAVAFTREAYVRTGGLNADFVHSYEDYEFFDRMTQAGDRILCTPRLAGDHAHREGFRVLMRDYFYTGMGAADFVVHNRSSRLARRRIHEVVTLGLILAGIAFVVTGVLVSGNVPALYIMPSLVLGVFAGAGLYCIAAVRRWVAGIFPLLTAFFGLASWVGFIRRWFEIRHSGVQETLICEVRYPSSLHSREEIA